MKYISSGGSNSEYVFQGGRTCAAAVDAAIHGRQSDCVSCEDFLAVSALLRGSAVMKLKLTKSRQCSLADGWWWCLETYESPPHAEKWEERDTS